MTEVNIFLPRKTLDVSIQESFSEGITGIYGPSGSGKTSLLQAIAGLAKPQKGNISIEGKMVFDSGNKTNIPVEKRNIGYVFQEGRLFPHMSVLKNLTYGLKRNGINDVQLNEVIGMLNLEHLLQSKPSQISGGERQRTALGRSLLSSPDILLLDEPFSAVDTYLRKQILPFLIRIQKSVSIPILVVSHDLPDLLKLTHTLFVMQNGKCVGHGDYFELLKSKKVAAIFGTNKLVNALDMHVFRSSPETGLTLLRWKDDKRELVIKGEKSTMAYTKGQRLKVFIDADDIALSTERIGNVTIQNQIEGVIEELIDHQDSVLCVVNAGFKLLVEITTESQRRLGLKKGKWVWCLFKSVAIDVVG